MAQQVLPVAKDKATAIGEFLTNNVSRAVVYALMHKQPMTREEIERSPFTDHMRRLSVSAQTRPLKDKSGVQMRTLLAKGVDCGLLLPLNSKRKNYYFLNSDLRLEPAPIREGDEEELALNVYLDRSFTHYPGEAVLPGWGTAADSTILPVPYIDSPKSFILWLSWLVTPTRRKIMQHIAETGSTTRPRLRNELGFWADRIVAKEGIPVGVLERVDGEIKFQFAGVSFSKLKRKEDEGKRKSWISFPPSFWMTRSYEPLRCIAGANKYVGARKPEATPVMVLEELAKESPTVVDKNRRDFLEVNFLERMSFYAVYHASGDSAAKITADSLIPEKVTYNAPEHPLVWVARTDEEHAAARLDFKQAAATMLQSMKSREEQVKLLEHMLQDMAAQRIGKRLEELQRLLEKDLDRLRVQSFGLGAESISAVAGLELQREEIEAEKRYFEKFMETLVPGSTPKVKSVEAHEMTFEEASPPGQG